MPELMHAQPLKNDCACSKKVALILVFTERKNAMKKLLVIFLMTIMVFSMIAGCTENTENEASETYSDDEESKYEALDSLKIKIYDIDPVKGKVPEREAEKSAVNYELPDIANYDPITKGSGDLDVEIFLPSEENGSNIQDVIKFAAEKCVNALCRALGFAP